MPQTPLDWLDIGRRATRLFDKLMMTLFEAHAQSGRTASVYVASQIAVRTVIYYLEMGNDPHKAKVDAAAKALAALTEHSPDSVLEMGGTVVRNAVATPVAADGDPPMEVRVTTSFDDALASVPENQREIVKQIVELTKDTPANTIVEALTNLLCAIGVEHDMLPSVRAWVNKTIDLNLARRAGATTPAKG